MLNWYAIRSKPNQEAVLCRYLQHEGFAAFFPTAKVQPINPRSAPERAYFPGYVFARLDLTKVAPSRLRSIPGAQGLVEFGDVPVTVSPGFVKELRRRIAEIEAAGGLVLAEVWPADGVNPASETLADRDAIFDLRLRGSDRAMLLLNMLGRHAQEAMQAGDNRTVKGRQTAS